MKREVPNKYISRKILSSLNSSGKFEKWMKYYLSSKEFYEIKRSNLFKQKNDNLSKFIIKKFQENNIQIDGLDVEFIIRESNKLTFFLLLIRSNILNTQIGCSLYLKNLSRYILKSRMKKSRIISIERMINNKNYPNVFNNLSPINIIVPVCPDYSYEEKNGRYQYTFKSLGSGIGLVAENGIRNSKYLVSLFDGLNELDYKITILVGDFEANIENFVALNCSEKEFYNKIEGSITKIKENSGFESDSFTKLCGGLKGWDNMIEITKKKLNISDFDDLVLFFKHLNHEKNLISRLPLYNRWFGSDANYKKIFFDQCIEYILMGYLIESYYGKESIILASDHKAMRPYYGLHSNISIVGSSAKY